MQRYEKGMHAMGDRGVVPQAPQVTETTRELDLRHEEDPELREMGQAMAVRLFV
eukprot:COSAG02_NODE_13270_length_1418_cov_0.698256_2_plen_54_part_00